MYFACAECFRGLPSALTGRKGSCIFLTRSEGLHSTGDTGLLILRARFMPAMHRVTASSLFKQFFYKLLTLANRGDGSVRTRAQEFLHPGNCIFMHDAAKGRRVSSSLPLVGTREPRWKLMSYSEEEKFVTDSNFLKFPNDDRGTLEPQRVKSFNKGRLNRCSWLTVFLPFSSTHTRVFIGHVCVHV